jgi:hypothetical protein
MWHREDNLHAIEFCAFHVELYCIDADRKNIVTMQSSGTTDRSYLFFVVESCVLAMTSPDMKYVTRLIIRVFMDAEAEMNLYAMYDSFPEWIHICNIKGTNLRSFSVPVRPRRCDHMKLKMTGHGDCKVYSFTKIIAQGSDIS